MTLETKILSCYGKLNSKSIAKVLDVPIYKVYTVMNHHGYKISDAKIRRTPEAEKYNSLASKIVKSYDQIDEDKVMSCIGKVNMASIIKMTGVHYRKVLLIASRNGVTVPRRIYKDDTRT